jgi:hypothetical protein
LFSQQPTDPYAAAVLRGLPVSIILNCGIELWRNLEIDDDELLEIAIRDVSLQIQRQKEVEEGRWPPADDPQGCVQNTYSQDEVSEGDSIASAGRGDRLQHRFNPRVDPTILLLEIRKLTLNLDRFKFRIEKTEKRTIFDPTFEGQGTLSIKNISIRIRVECAKERLKASTSGPHTSVPVLHLRELEVGLDSVSLQVKDTGSDWLFNKVVDTFQDSITGIVRQNLRDQLMEQVNAFLGNGEQSATVQIVCPRLQRPHMLPIHAFS